jgi:hypothetical protein
MPVPPDVVRILTEARDTPPDPDLRAAHTRVRRRTLGLRLPRWLATPRPGPSDGDPLPVLRDYPWRSTDRA